MQERTKSWVTYVVLTLMLAVAAIFIRRMDAGELAAPFAWPVIAGVAIGGAIGVLLTRRAGVPEMWEPGRDRFLVPAAVGALFGVVTILHAALDRGDGDVLPLSTAIVVFAAGAVLLEMMLRLFFVNVVAAIGGKRAFWIGVFLAALYEPLPYVLAALEGEAVMSSMLVAIRLFAFNVLAGYFYRRAGFIAALSVRWSDYLVWHIIGQNVLGLR